MILRVGFLLIWLAFSVYAFLLAPPDDPEATFELIRRLVSGDIAGINPLIVAEFNLMGVLPLAFWCLLFVDGHRQKAAGQKIPAWPFALAMMVVGAFALLPYLVLRRPAQDRIPLPLPWLLRPWNSAWTGRILALAAVGLVGYGVWQGDWGDFLRQWQTSRFIHVMTLDFLLLNALLPYLILEDRLGRAEGWPQWAVSFVPLLGALGYLSFRPAIAPEPTRIST